jgi:hypothetical protein
MFEDMDSALLGFSFLYLKIKREDGSFMKEVFPQ